jgi:hypothetical protein
MLSINSRGYSDIIHFNISETLSKLQQLIYNLTKDYIEDHNSNLDLAPKLQLSFKKTPNDKLWSEIMNTVNSSRELRDLINDPAIIEQYKKIFKKPKLFPISLFRARFPEQKKVIYNWHQDEGTWMMSKDKNILKKYPVTLWLSVNGSDASNSIHLVKNSHKNKLLNHAQVEGQGYFNADIIESKINPEDIFTVQTKPSEGIFFNSLTLHKSVNNSIKTLKPRYSIDIRYYEGSLISNFKKTLFNFF